MKKRRKKMKKKKKKKMKWLKVIDISGNDVWKRRINVCCGIENETEEMKY
jgi:hypothetical protein